MSGYELIFNKNNYLLIVLTEFSRVTILRPDGIRWIVLYFLMAIISVKGMIIYENRLLI